MRKPDQPFCFWYGAKEPHRRYEAGSGVKNGLDPATVKVPSYYPDHKNVRSDLLDYALEVNWFDKHLGEIVEHLREIGELDNTLIIATSDNGAPFPRIKGQIYDEDFRLPMAARWGDVHKGSAVVEDFINNIDIGPTFLEAAGVPIPDEMSGKSFIDIFKANKSGVIDPKRDSICVGRENHDLGREGDLKKTLTDTKDPRILGNGEVFDSYEYVGNKKANHSWKAYTEGRWKPQNY